MPRVHVSWIEEFTLPFISISLLNIQYVGSFPFLPFVVAHDEKRKISSLRVTFDY
jgi:hypothetical protein